MSLIDCPLDCFSQQLVNPFLKFYRDIDSKHYAVVVDCYAKIFLCDFINCIITIFTYQYFGVSPIVTTGQLMVS